MKDLQQKLQTMSTLLSRAQLAIKLGQQYNDTRDLYQALGYKLSLDYTDYAAYYERNEMAKAVINRPIDATWRGNLDIIEAEEGEDTPLEKEYKELGRQLKIKQVFIRLDKLASLGNYGVLFLGFDDVNDVSVFKQPIPAGEHKLLYVKPYGQGLIEIQEYERNVKSPRYGLPIIYKLTMQLPGGNTTKNILVHYSRIIHVAGELLISEYKGVPALQVIFNRLMDLEKLVGGSAEMFWRGARPGYQGKIDPDFRLTSGAEEDLKDQIDEYEHNLRRILINQGIDLQALVMQIADPTPHVDVQIQMISAVTGIPKRILTGSERGELASSEDKSNWLNLIQARREEYAELQIVRPFVDRCIEYGALPRPKEEGGYSVIWEDLFAQSDKELAEIGRTRAEALRAYTSTPTAEDVVPPESFYRYFLGLDADQIEQIKLIREASMKEEAKAFGESEEE